MNHTTPNYTFPYSPYPMATPKCYSMQHLFPQLIDLPLMKWSFGLLYSLIWLLSLFGNGVVMFFIMFRQLSRSVRMIFIFNLALSDLIITLLSLPFTAITIFAREWIFPRFLCYPIGFFQGGSMFVSSLTLMMIAVDRYFLICRPHLIHWITYARAKGVVASGWVVGHLLVLPMLLFTRLRTFRHLCGEYCVEEWPDASKKEGQRGYSVMQKGYSLVVLLLQFGLPALVCFYCYTNIATKMKSRVNRRRNRPPVHDDATNSENLHSSSTLLENRMDIQRRRTNKRMIALVFVFIFGWLPMNLINILRDFHIIRSDYYSLVFAFVHVIAMSTMVIDPIIYGMFTDQIRKAIWNAISLKRYRSTRFQASVDFDRILKENK